MKDLIEKYMSRGLMEGEGSGSGGGEAAASGGSEAAAANTALTAEPAAAADDKPAAAAAGSDGDKKPNAAEAMYGDGDKPKEQADDDKAKAEAEAKAKEEEEKKGKEKDGEEPKPLALEDIDLTPPEGFELDAEVGDAFKQFAVENNLTKEQVKTLTDMQVKLYEKQTAAHADKVKEWGESLASNKEIGGPKLQENLGYARAAINEFFSPEAKQMLDLTGLGNHPDFVVGFVRLGKAMGEGPSPSGQTGNKSSLVDAWYSDTAS